MSRQSLYPDQERLSIVVATILLAYALTQLLNVPQNIIPFSIAGILIPINLSYANLVAIAVAGMTASGTDWLLRDHPQISGRSTFPHLLLPAMTSWVLNVTLTYMANTPLKWGLFILGGGFLLAVILAEYTVVSQEDYRRPISIALLTALSYVLFLALVVSLHSSDQRLITMLPAVALGAAALSMRVIQLQITKQWPAGQAAACTLFTLQIAAALHYLPIVSLSFGLMLLGSLYFITTFIISLEHETTPRRAGIEAAIPLVLLWIIALWLN